MKNELGQRITHAILRAAAEFRRESIELRLQWIPGHCDPGNDSADLLAKEAARPGETHPFQPRLMRENAFLRGKIHAQWGQEWKTSTTGAHLRKMDGGLPARYTRKLYGKLPRNLTYLLTQLRTRRNSASATMLYVNAGGRRQSPTC